MSDIYLVSCVKTKRNGEHPAKDLYCSDWFKKARAYVEKQNTAWYILSAKYYLLEPDTVISAYNQTLNKMPVKDRNAWALNVFEMMKKIIKPQDTVYFLAGKKYREFLLDKVGPICAHVEVPMEGLRSGEQKQWLRERI